MAGKKSEPIPTCRAVELALVANSHDAHSTYTKKPHRKNPSAASPKQSTFTVCSAIEQCSETGNCSEMNRQHCTRRFYPRYIFMAHFLVTFLQINERRAQYYPRNGRFGHQTPLNPLLNGRTVPEGTEIQALCLSENAPPAGTVAFSESKAPKISGPHAI